MDIRIRAWDCRIGTVHPKLQSCTHFCALYIETNSQTPPLSWGTTIMNAILSPSEIVTNLCQNAFMSAVDLQYLPRLQSALETLSCSSH
jgi:hypothetical protein